MMGITLAPDPRPMEIDYVHFVSRYIDTYHVKNFDFKEVKGQIIKRCEPSPEEPDFVYLVGQGGQARQYFSYLANIDTLSVKPRFLTETQEASIEETSDDGWPSSRR